MFTNEADFPKVGISASSIHGAITGVEQINAVGFRKAPSFSIDWAQN
jgi:hypothetical protein